jgi:hypothetical protein
MLSKICPGQKTYASPLAIELWAIRSRRSLDATARIAMSAIVTLVIQRMPCLLPFDLHVTTRGRVQGYCVSFCPSVVRLHNINLSVQWPIVRITEPQSGPCPAAIRRMDDIEDEKTSVIRSLGLQSNRPSASSGGLCRRVHPQYDRRFRSIGEI